MHGRSHLLLRNSGKKRMKVEENKEIVLVHSDLQEENNELILEIQELKNLVNEYKMLNLEDLEYKEKYNDLIKDGMQNRSGEEMIKF